METYQETMDILGEVVVIKEPKYSDGKDIKIVIPIKNPNRPRLDDNTFFGVVSLSDHRTIIVPLELVQNTIDGPVVYSKCILCENKGHCTSVPIVRITQSGIVYEPKGATLCTNCNKRIETWINSAKSLVEEEPEDIASHLL